MPNDICGQRSYSHPRIPGPAIWNLNIILPGKKVFPEVSEDYPELSEWILLKERKRPHRGQGDTKVEAEAGHRSSHERLEAGAPEGEQTARCQIPAPELREEISVVLSY